MTQARTLSSSGMFTQFKLTRVLRTVDLDYNNLLTALSVVQVGKVFNNLPMVVVDKSQQPNGGRVLQKNVLKAVLISKELYADSLIANPTVIPFITEIPISDDFFVPNGSFIRTLTKVAPTQTRISNTFEVGGGGLVNLGVAFVDATVISSLAFTATNGAAGTITYPLGDVGSAVTISYVTQAIHPTVLITRQERQTVSPALVIKNEVSGVLLNSVLAGLLGLTLPPY